MNSEDITLRKVGAIEPDSLPHGVKAVIFDNRVVFVRRVIGSFVQLPAEEQERLYKKHVK